MVVLGLARGQLYLSVAAAQVEGWTLQSSWGIINSKEWVRVFFGDGVKALVVHKEPPFAVLLSHQGQGVVHGLLVGSITPAASILQDMFYFVILYGIG